MGLRPRHEWLVVELEPEKQTGSIIRVSESPIRIGRVVKAGPGKECHVNGDVVHVRDVEPGERVAFFKAVADTKQGQQVRFSLEENQLAIKMKDVLFVIEGDAQVEL